MIERIREKQGGGPICTVWAATGKEAGETLWEEEDGVKRANGRICLGA